MNGSSHHNGRGDAARSRKKVSSGNGISSSNGNDNTHNNNINNGGIYDIISDSSASRRNDRMAMRKKRVHRSRARKSSSSGKSNGLALCIIGSGIFVIYLLVCLLFFHNLDDGDEEASRGMRGLVKKTKEQIGKLRHKHDMIEEQMTNNNNSEETRVDMKTLKDLAPNDINNNPAGVPIGLWPISIRDEDGKFEDITHPGVEDGSVIMSVPKFWAEDPVSIHQNKLMSRERALSIGTCITPDSTGKHTRGDKCPLNERTIFVAIASYRDWQCRDTVTSLFAAATHPERVRVGVVDQIVAGEDGSCDIPHSPCSQDPNQPICLHKNQIDVYQMEAELAIGPVFARHVGHRLYRGEYYSMQSDSHVTFTKGWDVDIIQQIESTGDEMAVLSTYLTDIVGSIDPKTGLSLRKTRPIMCNTEYEGGPQGKHLRHLSQPEGMPDIHGMPQLQPYWAAGYSFSRGHFVATVPYDLYQPMIFQGEEMSIGLRGFTIGYDFFAPERSVCFHHYAKGENAAARNKVPHFWEHSNKYAGEGVKAMKRLLGIVHMNPEVPRSEWNHAEEARYGIGGARETSKFYETIGIDVVHKTTEGHLCQFVRGKMHNMFMKVLRPDGMGIDYSKIDFKWKDPRPGQP